MSHADHYYHKPNLNCFPLVLQLLFAQSFKVSRMLRGVKKTTEMSSSSSLLFSGVPFHNTSGMFPALQYGRFPLKPRFERVNLMPFFRKRVQRYCFFFNPPNIFAKKCKKNAFLGLFWAKMGVEIVNFWNE